MPGFGGGGFAVPRSVYPTPIFRKYVAGNYYGAVNHGIPGLVANGTGLCTAIPFWVGATFTADRIGAEITTGAGSAVVRLGIYLNTANDGPGTLGLDAGTIDASGASSTLTATISYTFNPGLYWLSAVSQVASATLRTVGQSALAPLASTTFAGSVATQGMNCIYNSGITGALADWSGGTVASNGYKVMVRAA